MAAMTNNIILTGFMGAGKSRIGRILAQNLQRPFVDMDRVIEQRQGKNIAQIFAEYGESFFRELEKQICFELAQKSGQIIATGGGTWANSDNRTAFEKDSIFCLKAPLDVLKERLKSSHRRPLAPQADGLYRSRKPIYDAILHQINTHLDSPDNIAARIGRLYELDQRFGPVPSHFYPIVIQKGLFSQFNDFTEWLSVKRNLVISNPGIIPNADILIPAGESYKNLDTVQKLYEQLLERELSRQDTLVAVGGGVVGDIVGFVAATFLRGISLIQVPTTLLAMVDSSIGGKTGVDLKQGKNLVGAFKNPLAVLIDPNFLKTLAPQELACGMAEVLKHPLISHNKLFY